MARRTASLAVAAALLWPAASGRADEGDRALSVSLSYGTYTAPDERPHGAVLGGDYELGFSSSMSFRASAGAGMYEADGRSYSAHAVIGLTYVIDVVKYVPYGNLGAGAIVIGGDGVDTEVFPLLELGLGVDVLRGRAFSFGPQVRFESFVSETSFFTAGLRLTWRWGFF